MHNNTKDTTGSIEVEQVRKLLQLCFLQAKLAVNTNEKDVDNLISRFTRLVELEQELRVNISQHQDCHEQMQELRQLISFIITDFQFFDRLKQQVTNAVEPIRTWTETGDLADPYAEDFIDRYTTQEERDIYQVAINEESIEVAEQKITELQLYQGEHDDEALLF